ncbi:T9SS type A sorting domain-containing protein [Pontibacter anaerobius]|uniref:T9SS type A sorting domain-containing protein n=1 Tax=Pontibacter anaerobius TaxID=2993940 RepID=A0ABT3RB43_9BACT|nr:T9SS type A sorting domain-containing protein [Pontibacter anaerobius]MCX2738717.1 T9SS type A sorting domain-containing protein [Pontibacter anaerobius]
MKTKLYLSVLAFLLLPVLARATHINGGFISYTVDPQNPRNFNFTLTLITNHFSTAEDPDITAQMGDGNSVIVPRASVKRYNDVYDLELFRWTYTYATPGNYTVGWIGPNRDHNILNMQSPSDILSYYAYTTVIANPLSANRHGIHLAGLPILEGSVGEPLKHNLAAYDADGDKLIYQLVTLKMQDREGNIRNVPGYEIPNGLTIDEYGELRWDAPAAAGRYAIAVQMIEYRNGLVQGLGVADFMVIIAPKEKDIAPSLALLNKGRLTQNDDGSVNVKPGELFKLEYFLRKHPNSATSVKAMLHSEIDTLELVPVNVAVRDSADGKAVTVSFTPAPEMVREHPYIIALSALSQEKHPQSDSYYPSAAWEFTYVYVGEHQPTSSEGGLKEPGFTLYPNPVANKFIVEAPDMPGMFVHFFDANGKRTAALKLKPGKNHFARPASFSSGLYFYTIYSRFKPVGSGKLVVK